MSTNNTVPLSPSPSPSASPVQSLSSQTFFPTFSPSDPTVSSISTSSDTPSSTSSSSPSPSPSTSSSVDSTPPLSVTSTSALVSTTSSFQSVSGAQQSSLTSVAPATSAVFVSSASSSVPGASTPFAAPSSTATHSTSSGFFSNTAAVAGTFTVVALIGTAIIIAIVLLIVRRRQSSTYDEDTEYLDKMPDVSADPPLNHVTSFDDVSSDHAHYGAPPMAIANPPAVYYPEHSYALHPQAFQTESIPHPLPQVGYVQHYPVYSPQEHDVTYPPSTQLGNVTVFNPHDVAHMLEPDAAPSQAHIALPDVLRPSARSTPVTPQQQESTRLSVDSFYSGIAPDTPVSPGLAI